MAHSARFLSSCWQAVRREYGAQLMGASALEIGKPDLDRRVEWMSWIEPAVWRRDIFHEQVEMLGAGQVLGVCGVEPGDGYYELRIVRLGDKRSEFASSHGKQTGLRLWFFGTLW